jgi:serine phosphatase RsbU (regulator of sigma subunit)
VGKLNEQMQEAAELDKFVTLSVGLLDPAQHQVTFVNAGHLAPILYRKATGKLEEATSRDLSGYPLGIVPGIPYDSATLTLEPGDCLALFTDGVTEAKNKNDQEFTLDRVLATLRSGPMTPRPMGERLVAAVKQHSLGCKQHDDITVVCFGRMS